MKIKIICLLLVIFFIAGCFERERNPIVKIMEGTIKSIDHNNGDISILFSENNLITVKKIKSECDIYEGQKGTLYLSGPYSYTSKYVYIWISEDNTKLEIEE